ncbi:receptor-like protein 36 [Salvia hispanica]|uniref:receptor-like protein 36 n=1 Tax=Salvia hispanica TaxID=49212 RepID=UPI00200950D4|nr:receptor-like protein 36 [Salvia hispanica]
MPPCSLACNSTETHSPALFPPSPTYTTERLALWENNLTGANEPLSSLTNCPALKFLEISFNYERARSSPSFDREFPDPLEVIRATYSDIRGGIPSEIGNLTSLLNLQLSGNKLTGSIPTTIRNLENLQVLRLGENQLEGKITNDLCQLRMRGDLNMSANLFTGSIPGCLGEIQTLRSISFAMNKMNSAIPLSFWSLKDLVYLELQSNQLSGELPPLIGDLKEIDILDLSYNQFSGEIPTSITNASRVSIIDLSSNSFTGSIPNFCNLSQLEFLDLSKNNLTGAESPNQELGFLSSLSNCPNLSYLDISNNPMMNGVLPASFGNLSVSLVTFTASNCSIRGFIPPIFRKGCSLNYSISMVISWKDFYPNPFPIVKVCRLPFPKLQVFDISHNAFIGNLPQRYLRNFKGMMDVQENHPVDQERVSFYRYSLTLTVKGSDLEYENLLTTFTTIDMSSNRFSGSIPNSIGNLNFLIYLNLSHNCLTGGIPASLGNVAELESLDLSSNRLEGEIPTELTKLTFLAVINLSMNNLSGKIPQSKGPFSTFENTSYAGKFLDCVDFQNENVKSLRLLSCCKKKIMMMIMVF